MTNASNEMLELNIAHDISKPLDHPCKATCSGWKQGVERGYRQAIADLRAEGYPQWADLLEEKLK